MTHTFVVNGGEPALYPLPPERAPGTTRPIVGDVDCSFAVNELLKGCPTLYVSFKGGMTFEGRPLFVCEIGSARIPPDAPIFWYGEASDKASAFQKAVDEMFHWSRMRKYLHRDLGCWPLS